MGKKGVIVEKWIDLSSLPTQKNKAFVDWKHSVGHHIPFKYGKASGHIEILNYISGDNSQGKLLIFIDKYMDMPKYVKPNQIKKCMLSRIVGNRIIDERPDLVQYLSNPNDAYKFSVCARGKINTRCPLCGYEHYMPISQLSLTHFVCPVCGDGISYPNKFVASVLKQLNISFLREVGKNHNGFHWAKSYRYDFAFQFNGKTFIIEADGGFHKKQDQIVVDNVKSNLAVKNGCSIIRINCDYIYTANRCEFIKDSILNSQLSNMFNLKEINWNQCDTFALSNLCYEACRIWEDEHYSVQRIAEILDATPSTIGKYLKRGHCLGLCDSYNANEAYKRGSALLKKPVGFIDDNNNIVEAFLSSHEAFEKYGGTPGFPTTQKGFDNAFRNSKKKYYGLTLKQITKEEYEQYKMINRSKDLREVFVCI